MQGRTAQILARSEKVKTIAKTLGGEGPIGVFGVCENAVGPLLAALYKASGKQVIYVSASPSALKNAAAYGFLFPENDIELRSLAAKSREGAFARIEALCGKKKIIVMSAKAFIARLMPKDEFLSEVFTLKAGDEYDMEKLCERLVYLGYERETTVYSKGQFSRRGEVLDIFPLCRKSPVRMSFFDTQIESLRRFDPETQKSTGEKEAEVVIYPAREHLVGEKRAAKAISYLEGFAQNDTEAGASAREMLFSLKEFADFENADSFCSLLYEECCAADYFDNAMFVFDDMGRIKDDAEAQESAFEENADAMAVQGQALPAQKNVYADVTRALKAIEKRSADICAIGSRFDPKKSVTLDFKTAPLFNGNLENLAVSLKQRLKSGYTVALCVGGKAKRLSQALLELDVIAPVSEEAQGIYCSAEVIAHGFEAKDEKLYFLGEGDVFGSVKRAVPKKRPKKTSEDVFAELKAGDYIVHEVHGKGRYLGLKTMEAAGATGEYLEIEYRDGDKLYVPTWQIDRVQKYMGGDDGAPMLSRLGSKEWENAKKRARESVAKLAFDLVALYADRFEHKGYAFSEDSVWQSQFEDSFEFEETEGQKKSIAEVKRDMESEKVMDRLVLGDVGYGKTEVAMRACFKAVQDSKQACVLVPTTLLARQHYETFKKRFDGFPVTIDVMSRYTAGREKQSKEDIKRGKTDIVIGTHKLLSKDICFKDLGLLIIDEEQRFGVSHKEKIKLLKKSVDVLTLSATPIPRTLEMSLIGVRDLSTIKTPPTERQDTSSFVVRYSPSLARQSIEAEIRRGGQVYFVVRRVSQIARIVSELEALVPQARVAAAHGQMAEGQMESVVSDFIDGKTDVLVCTTIIESGIDIPAVNTIIIYEADKFGLSQLYQLKGRVGRSERTSFAYFTYLSDAMGENAKKRLAAIKEFTSLGSGFKIAMRDLQIRGAGNLLGPEQSGHMAAVGYNLYCKMMKQEVAKARGGRAEEEEEFETAVDLGTVALIPDRYIKDEAHKIDMYKAIARISTVKEAKETREELADRYGRLPKETDNLITLSLVKAFAHRAGIASVIKKGAVIELKYVENVNIDPQRILRFLEENGKTASMRASEPPVIVCRVKGAKALIEFLNGLKHCKKRF